MNTDGLITLAQAAIAHAEQHQSKLPLATLLSGGTTDPTGQFRGVSMSGRKGRHLLNNLAAQLTPYLEIGTFMGGTLLSAGYRNSGLILGVDNFVYDFQQLLPQPLDPRSTLLSNLAACPEARVSFLEGDCFSLPPVPGFQCVFFDGDHTEEAQCQALTVLKSWYTETFIYVVDDWNWPAVRRGTDRGLREGGYEVACSLNLGSYDADAVDAYWNGMGLFVLRKCK